jgi:hypothetical protein
MPEYVKENTVKKSQQEKNQKPRFWKWAGCWWLTPAILATQEAENRGIIV